MMRSAPFRLHGALALLALLGACADVGPDVDGLAGEVAEHRQIWASRRPATYSFGLERQCFCTELTRGPVRLTVQGDRVMERAYSDSGEPVPDEYVELFPDIDGLFDVLEEAIARPADRIDVTWDPDTGAPVSFFIDYSEMTADEELGYRVASGPS